MPKSAPSTVVEFVASRRPVREVSVTVAPRAAIPEVVTAEPGIDLSDKPRIVFLIGSGNTGKSLIARWMIERGRAAGRKALLAAMDPVNRSLVDYFKKGVSEPPSSDPAESANWLRDLLEFAMDGQHSAVIDLGGGDTTLATVLSEMPNLADVLAEVGMAAVALYTLSPRVDDIGPFKGLRFQPAATAFICNHGTQAGDFGPLIEQPLIREAVEAGARVVQMPRLDLKASTWAEENRMLFGSVAGNEPNADGDRPGPWRSVSVRNWLRAMDQAFEPIGTWLA